MAKLISLKKAAKMSDYTTDYLGYLIREKKLWGKRVGRDWFTTEESLKSYLLTKKFLPIKDILFSKINPRLALLVVTVLSLSIITGVLLVHLRQPPGLQKSPGDFENRAELHTEKVIVGEEQATKEIKVTTYSSDETGAIEISIEEE